MRPNGAMVMLPALVSGQIITVTEYASSCEATYTTAYTYTASSSGSRTSTVVQSTVIVTPLPSSNVDPSGACGASTGTNCYGAPDGSCCSQYGFCGSGPAYCGTGCQPGFGTCDTIPNSVAVSSSYVQIPTVIGGSSTYTSILATGSSTMVSPPVYPSASAAPLTDDAVNEGTPFVIEIRPVGPSKLKRQAAATRSFLDIDGYITSDPNQAVVYVINDGEISVASGGLGQVTADAADDDLPFAATQTLKSIRTTFYSGSLQLGWNNTAFAGGAAEFFLVGEGGSSRLMVHLNGDVDDSWTAVNFAITATPHTPVSSTAPVTATATAASPVLASSSAVAPPAYSSAAPIVSPPAYSSAAPIVSPPAYSSTVALSVPPIVVSSSSGVISSAVIAPPGYSSGAASHSISTSLSLVRSASGSVTYTSTSIIAVTVTPVVPTTAYIATEGTNMAPPPTLIIASSETASYSLISTGSSVQPIFSSDFSFPISVSSFASTASSINVAPSYPTQSSAPVIPLSSPISSAASSISSAAPSVSSSAAAYSARSSISSASSSARSSIANALSLPAVSSAPAFTTTTTTTRSSTAPPSGTGAGICPDDNNFTATDSNGVQYVVSCGSNFPGADISHQAVTGSYTQCYTLCDAITNCGGFIWQGDGSSFGTGTGYCYFKSFSQQADFQATSDINVAAINPQYVSGNTGAPVLTAQAVSISDAATPSPVPYSSAAAVSQASACATNAVPNPQFYASATVDRASSWLVLPTPTACDFGDPDGWPIDDSYCNIDLPNPVQYYGRNYATVFGSTNGILSFDEGSTQYEDVRLPTADIPTFSLAPFWDDTAMFGNATRRQGVYYQYDTSGVTWEYYLSRPYVSTLNFHYTISYTYANPGVYVIEYLNVDDEHQDQGGLASVGMQGADSSDAIIGFPFSYRTKAIYTGLVLTCNTNRNICTSCTQAGLPEQVGPY